MHLCANFKDFAIIFILTIYSFYDSHGILFSQVNDLWEVFIDMLVLGKFKSDMDNGLLSMQEHEGVSYFDIPRHGEASRLRIPVGVVGALVSDMDLDEATSAIVATDVREATSLLTNRFGILAGTKAKPNVLDCNLIFVDDGVVLTINSGRVMVQIADEYYVLDDEGELEPASVSEVQRASWVEVKSLRESCEAYTKIKFHLKSADRAREYVSNMMINTIFTYTPPGSGVTLEQASYVLNTRFAGYFDIGLGRFQPDHLQEEHVDVSDLPDEDELDDPDFDLLAEVDEEGDDLDDFEDDDLSDFEEDEDADPTSPY